MSGELVYHYAASAANPYAWDEALGADPAHEVRYNELESLESAIIVSFHFSTILGGALTWGLLYLVLFRTHGELKSFSKMLLLSCICDLMYWCSEAWIQVVCKVNDGVFLIKITGPARFLSYFGQANSVCVYASMLTFCATILPSQYFSRYYAISRGRSLNSWEMFGLWCTSLLFALPMGLLAMPAYWYSGQKRPGFNYGRLWYRVRPMPTVVVGDMRDPRMAVYFGYAFVALMGSYLICIYLGYLTVHKLSQKKHMFSERTQAMQKQLNAALLVQSIVPLLVSVGPGCLIVVPSFLGVDTGCLAVLLGNVLSWIPVFNPLFTMLAISPYRRLVLRTFLHGPRRLVKRALGRPVSVMDQTSHGFSVTKPVRNTPSHGEF